MIKENFIKLFESSFRNHYDLPAYSDFGKNNVLTYAEVAQQVARLHLLFEQCNVKKDDKIALIGKDGSQWATLYIATITYGAVIVPILKDFNPKDITYILNHSKSKLLFANDDILNKIDNQQLETVEAVFSLADFSNTHIVSENCSLEKQCVAKDTIDELFEKKYPNGFSQKDIHYVEKSNAELVCLSYTSGTTGFSKGVMLSGNSLAGNVTLGISTKLLKKGNRVVSFLPLAHAYGCAFDFLTGTVAGAHVTFLGRIPVASILLKAFAQVRPSVIFSVPLILEKIYKKQILPILNKKSTKIILKIPFLNQLVLNKIKNKLYQALGGNFSQVIIGGAPLNADVEDFFTKINFPFTVGYGMTECGPLISYSYKDEFVPKSSGKVLDIMEAKIENPNTEGIGEILVRGENVMLGYYRNEEATTAILDKDGWLRTGDLGFLDKNNNLFIKGRNKTMILSASGQNIFPEEIEAKLNNMPYVAESLVVESEKGLVALVYPEVEVVRAEKIDSEQLAVIMEENRKELNSIVAKYEAISKIQIMDKEFEKTPKKSIKRFLYNNI